MFGFILLNGTAVYAAIPSACGNILKRTKANGIMEQDKASYSSWLCDDE